MTPAIATWQQELANAFHQLDELCHYLEIDRHRLPVLDALPNFPLRVPRGFVDCMAKGDVNDPLLRQILPVQAELQPFPGYQLDPVGDLNAVAEAGVLHKYQGRVLLISTGACAVHCRYCFRRNFPYGEQQLSRQKLQMASDYIAARPDISEVILSGGDPLLLSDERLEQLLAAISGIAHVKRIRIHSRLPVVLPSRITADLLQLLQAAGKRLVMVIHANHGNELSSSVAAACQRMKQSGIDLLNQSVLLQGVNDNAEVLSALSERLFALGVLPYYLHLLDKAVGVGHFEVDRQQALALLSDLQRRLPGYLVPRLVEEQAGAAYKLAVS